MLQRKASYTAKIEAASAHESLRYRSNGVAPRANISVSDEMPKRDPGFKHLEIDKDELLW